MISDLREKITRAHFHRGISPSIGLMNEIISIIKENDKSKRNDLLDEAIEAVNKRQKEICQARSSNGYAIKAAIKAIDKLKK